MFIFIRLQAKMLQGLVEKQIHSPFCSRFHSPSQTILAPHDVVFLEGTQPWVCWRAKSQSMWYFTGFWFITWDMFHWLHQQNKVQKWYKKWQNCHPLLIASWFLVSNPKNQGREKAHWATHGGAKVKKMRCSSENGRNRLRKKYRKGGRVWQLETCTVCTCNGTHCLDEFFEIEPDSNLSTWLAFMLFI